MAGFVLQYNNCIVTRAVEWLKLYCNMVDLKGCFLYCNTHGVLWLRRDLGLRIVLQYNYCIET